MWWFYASARTLKQLNGSSFSIWCATRVSPTAWDIYADAMTGGPEVHDSTPAEGAYLEEQARRARPLRPDPRIYMVIGWLEGVAGEEGVYARLQQRMLDTLAVAGFDTTTEVRSVVRADGKHAEWFWRREFPTAYLWLFGKR